MKELRPTEHMQLAGDTLRVIDKLLSIPAGEQIYCKQLKTLFTMLELLANPIYTTHD